MRHHHHGNWFDGIDVTPTKVNEACGCATFGDGEDQQVMRRMYRGDSLAFRTQVFQNIRTTRRFTVPIVDPAWPPPPNAIPFSLASGISRVSFTLKRQVQDMDVLAIALLDSSTLAGVTIEAGSLGFLDVLMPPIDTQVFPDGPVRLTYDCKVFETSGRVSTVERGHLVVVPTSTRAIT